MTRVEHLAGVLFDLDGTLADTIDVILAEAVRTDGQLRTALDLEGGAEIVNFLARSLHTPETFAFPLIARGKAFGAITLYLSDAYPFEEADVRGLQAIGNVLRGVIVLALVFMFFSIVSCLADVPNSSGHRLFDYASER